MPSDRRGRDLWMIQVRRMWTASWYGIAVGMGVVGGSLVGCEGVTPVAPANAPITDPTRLYTKLTVDHSSVVLSTDPSYNTIQLVATARDAQGNAMSDVPVPMFTSLDTASVSVDSITGVVTALAPTGVASVVATLTVGSETHADTVTVQVTNLTNPPKLASLSPAPTDSTVWAWQPIDGVAYEALYTAGIIPWPLTVTAVARDTAGMLIDGLPIAYRSVDSTVATIDQFRTVRLLRPGTARFIAEVTAYGITKAVTITYTVTPPAAYDVFLMAGVTGALDFSNDGSNPSSVRDIRIAPSGVVLWMPTTATDGHDTTDVIFDDPTNVVAAPAIVCMNFYFYGSPSACNGAGDVHIPPVTPDEFAAGYQIRQFPVPGIYPWHSPQLGISGRIIVSTGANP